MNNLSDAGTGRSNTGLKSSALGTLAITFFVVSAAGPLVAMAGGIPVAMAFGNGPGIPAMFLLATLILLTFSVGYTAMAREVRNAGAFYAFAATGLGGYAAGAAGLIALLSYNAIQIGLYGLFGFAAKELLQPHLPVAIPWWGYATLAFVSIAYAGYRRIDLSTKLLGLLVIAEYLIVLVLDIAIVVQGGNSGLSARPFAQSEVFTGSPAIGLMFCFAAYIGFEATSIYSEEARDPDKTIPRATYLSVLLIGVFYIFSTWALVNGIGVENVAQLLKDTDPTSILFNIGEQYVGSAISVPMQVLFVTSCYAGILAFHNTIARYIYAMGREGLLPKVLGQTHPRFQSPHMGSLAQSAIAAIAITAFVASSADPILVVFTLPSAIATLGVVALMALTALASFNFLRSRRELPGAAWKIPVAAVATVALSAVVLLAVVNFEVLAGSDAKSVHMLPLLILLFGSAGLVMAQRLKSSSPTQYAQLGRSVAS